jgi:ABC-type enterochelin transport system permease subunit
MSIYLILVIVKLADVVGLIIACLAVIPFRQKWMIPVVGLVTSVVITIITDSLGAGLPPQLMLASLVSGTIAYSVHALIFYFIIQLVRNKLAQKKTNSNDV